MAVLHHTYPIFAQHGSGILYHKSPLYIQPGYGLGTIFKRFIQFLVPFTRKALKTGSHLVNNSLPGVIDAVKDQALKVGINAVNNLIAGNSVKKPLQNDIANARKEIAKAVSKIQPGSGRKRRTTILVPKSNGKRSRQDIFTEDLFSSL